MLRPISAMERESLSMTLVGYMKVSGKMIRGMAEALSCMQMVTLILENTEMVKRREKVSIGGVMVKCMMASLKLD